MRRDSWQKLATGRTVSRTNNKNRIFGLVLITLIFFNALAIYPVLADSPTTTPSTSVDVIPPQITPSTPPTVLPASTRNDFEVTGFVPPADLSALSGYNLTLGIAQNATLPRGDSHHINPARGDDPRDPAAIRLADNNEWLLFFTDSSSNLLQQYNPSTALDPYWQSGNVIVTASVADPAIVQLNVNDTNTLGLFYIRTSGGTTSVMERTSTTDGASWSNEVQVGSDTTTIYHLRAITVGGVAYVFWSDNGGGLYYTQSSDLNSWSTPASTGRPVGQNSNNVRPSFDVILLANGNWFLTYFNVATVNCGLVCNNSLYPAIYTVLGTGPASWQSPTQRGDFQNMIGLRDLSVIQAPNGTLYLIYEHQNPPWLTSWAFFEYYITGSSDGLTWNLTENLFGCDPGVTCARVGSVYVTATNAYPYLDENGHVQVLWQMCAGLNGGKIAGGQVKDPYPDQLFQADLTTSTFFNPLPAYLDPAINYGLTSVGAGLVNVSSGNLVLKAKDYVLGGLGSPTTLTRTYNGGSTLDGIFGFGWSFPYTMGLQQNANGSVTVQNYDGRRDFYVLSGSNYLAPPGLETTLVHNGSAGWTLTYKDQSIKTFDNNGKLIGQTDASGNTTALAYTNGRLATITDAAGRGFTLNYDNNGRVTSINIPLARTLSYTYDAYGNLTSFTDPSGAVVHYTYTTNHMLTSQIDGSGRTTTFTWTSLRRIKNVVDPAGTNMNYTYYNQNGSGGTTTSVNGQGTGTINTYDNLGRQTKMEVMMPGGSGNNLITNFSYNSDSQLISQTDPRGIITHFTYDGAGNMTQKVVDFGTGKLNLTTNYVYTGNDLTSQTDPRGTNTTYVYDSNHRLISQTVHLDGGVNLATNYAYYTTNGQKGLLQSTTDPNGNTTNFAYDSYGNLSSSTNALNQTIHTTYDAGGRLLTSQDGLGQTTTYTYDAADHKLTTADPLNNTSTLTYSPDGESTSSTDPTGVITTTTYNRAGEATLVTPNASAVNFLISNPGFELGATYWTTSGTPSIVTTPVMSGAKAAKVDLTNTYNREIPVVVGKTYSLGAYAMGTAPGQTAKLAYAWRDASHTVLTSGTVTLPVSTSGFLPLTLAATVAPTNAAYLYLSLASSATGSWVIFDDVTPANSTLTDYNGAGKKLSVLDANGHLTRYTYDAASRLVTSVDARSKTTTYSYDKDGNLTGTTDATGVNTTFVYDNANRKTQVTVDTGSGNLNLISRATYDADNNLLSTTDPANHVTHYTYDRANRLLSVTDANNGLTSYTYDHNGNQLTTTDARSKITTNVYDSLNRLISLADSLDQITTSTYDAAGNRATVVDANGLTTTYSYDLDNRLTGISYSSGGSVSYTYDADGRKLSMIDGHGSTGWTYNALGQTTQISQPSVSAVNYTYDTVGNRLSLTVNNQTTNYTYNEVGLLASVSDWHNQTTTYAYDNDERLVGVAYPNGIAATYILDHAGRVTNLAYVKSGVTVASFGYTYNADNQRLTESSLAGTSTYTYDVLGRLATAAYPGPINESYTYDPAGNRLSLTTGGLTTNYTYNDANELMTAVTAGATTNYTYDADGNRTQVVVPLPADTSAPSVPTDLVANAVAVNEVDLSWTASTDNRAVSAYNIYRNSSLLAVVSGTTTSFSDFTTMPLTTYTYTISAADAAGNTSSQSSVAQATTPDGTPPTDQSAPSTPTNLTGVVVAAGRLDLSWTVSTDDVAVVGYNIYRDTVKINTVPVGSNTYSDTGLTPGVNHTYSVSALDNATNESAQSSTWSGQAGDGSLTTTYSYNPTNLLGSVTSGAQTLGSYTYDGGGNRVSKTVGAATTSYTLDLAASLSQVLSETTNNNLTSYVYGNGTGPSEVKTTTGGNTNDYWYLPDALGSTRALVDNTGTSVNSYAYLAFGNLRTSTVNVALNHLFTGQYTDAETGLVYLRARTYDPSTGTFLQRDNYNGVNQIPLTQNHYLYTQGDPVNRIDPSGYCDDSPWGMIGCAGDNLSGGWNSFSTNIKNEVDGVGDTVKSIVGGASDTIKNLTNGGGYVLNEVKETAFFLTNAAVDFSKQAIKYGMDHPTQVLALAGIVTACTLLGGPGDPLCWAVAGGALSGAGGYVIGHTGTSNWNLDDLASNMVLGEAIGTTLFVGLGPLGLAPKAPIWALTGAAVTTENLVGNALIGHPSGFSQLCSTVTSFIPGLKGLAEGLGCSATDRFLGN